MKIENEWKPIDTAPRDRLIDLWDGSNRNRLPNCHWSEKEGWMYFEISLRTLGLNITHWIDVPEGPK